MRKIIFLFAILCIAGVAFGQKEAKLVWEKQLNISPDPNNQFTLMGGVYNYQGNVLLGSSGQTWGFAQNGKELFNKNAYSLTRGDKINWFLATSASGWEIILVDKGLNILPNKIMVDEFKRIIEVEDGLLIFLRKKIIKYNFSGKELWQYQLKQEVTITGILSNRDNPMTSDIKQTLYHYDLSTGFSSTQRRRTVLRIDDKKVTELSFDTIPLQTVPTVDKGFWSVNSKTIKYDSTGKKMFEIDIQNLKFGTSEIKSISPVGVTPDGAIIFESKGKDDSELFFVKINIDGKIQITDKINVGNYTSEYPLNVTVVSEDIFLFTGKKDEDSVGSTTIFGRFSFVDNESNWFKTINGTTEVGIVGTRFLAPSTDKFEVYTLNGALVWTYQAKNFYKFNFIEQSEDYLSIYEFKNDIKEYIYLQEDSKVVSKIRVSNGELIWKSTELNTKRLLKEDSNGNSYWVNHMSLDPYFSDWKRKLFIVSKTGRVLGKFESPKRDWNTEGVYATYERPTFTVDTENKSFYTIPVEEQPDKSLKFVLRKYDYRCVLDLEASASIIGTSEACPNEKVKLSTTKQDGLTYQWQKDGKDIPTFRDAVHDVAESGTYRVVVREEICQNTAISNELKVSIRALPTAEIKGTQTTLCLGDKSTLTATTNGTFFQWQKDDQDIPNATSGSYEASESGNYRVSVRDDKCPQRGFSNTHTIRVKPLPEATISTDIKGAVYEPLSVKLFANTGTGLSYQWLKNDTLITNATSFVYEAKKSGRYAVSITQDGCRKQSDTLSISILIPLSNSEEEGEEIIRIYPNPSRGAFNVVLPKSLQNAEIQLFDILSRERTLTYIGDQVQADGLVRGTYFLRVTKGEKSITNKIVVE
jgi:Secretion system C-terminal sorting domain